ncbi:MAG TPA: hypothetical protein DCR14_06335 [Acidimicrobiaceae bacterium]|mgnify:CR=1 FL=1|nr:hypothetical protein [Acidimicrobiaceae bacterium]
MRRTLAALTIATASVAIGAPAAFAGYPPQDTTDGSVVGGGAPGGGGQIPETGSDSSDTLRLAAIGVGAGAVLVTVAGVRRRRSSAA